LPRSWRQGHSRLVKRRERTDGRLFADTIVCVCRYDMEPYDVGRIRGRHRGKQFVEPLMVMLFPHLCLRSIYACLGFTYYDYPGIYNDSNFHHCGLEPDDNIVNYDNEVEVWTCQLEGLAECVRVFASFLFSRPYMRQFGNRYRICSRGACRVHQSSPLPGSRWTAFGRGEEYVLPSNFFEIF
jgi:hypothetical protein